MAQRKMIAITPSGDPDAWAAWLDHYRGSKNETQMRECARQGVPFHVWTLMPEWSRASSSSRMVPVKPLPQAAAPAPFVPDLRDHAVDGLLDALAARLAERAALDAADAKAGKARHKGAKKDAGARDKAFEDVRSGQPPVLDGLSDLDAVSVYDPDEAREVADGKRDAAKLKPRVKLVSLRDDPIGQMAKRAQITPVELEAARHWQALYDTAAIAGARGIDPCAIQVDGGRFTEPVNDVQRAAMKRLIALDAKLGEVGASLVRRVLGDRMTVTQVAAISGNTSDKGVKFVAKRLHECLDTLASGMRIVAEGAARKTPNDNASRLAEHARNPTLYRAVRHASRKIV